MKAPWTPLLIALLAVSAFLAVAALAPAAADDLLMNGGFEEGADHWQEAQCTFGLTSDPSLVLVGGFAAALTDESELGWVGQVVQVQAGATYSFSGWTLKDDENIERVFLRIRWYGSEDGFGQQLSYVASAPVTGDCHDYRSVVVTAAAPLGAHSARVECVVKMVDVPTGTATTCFDDMSFTGPAPSTPTTCTTPTPAPTAIPTAVPSPTPTATATVCPTPETTAEPAPTPAATPEASPTPMVTPEPTPTSDGAKADAGDILINEVQYDPPQSGHEEHRFEWVELYNPTNNVIEIQGWSLTDNVESDLVPSLTLPQGGFAVIAASEGFHANFPDFEGAVVFVQDGRIGNGLNNDGDCLILKDSSGDVIDAISYGDDSSSGTHHPGVAEGRSVERSPPGEGLVDNPSPTPGRGLYPAATPTPFSTPGATLTPTPAPITPGTSMPAGTETGTATPMASPTPQASGGGTDSALALRAILIVAAIACLGIGLWLRKRRGK